MLFIETDAQGNLSGTAFQQQSVTASTEPAGTYVFYVSGSGGTSPYGAAGGFSTNTNSSATSMPERRTSMSPEM